eukprot:1143014-Amphidinium_carterae.1
MGCLLVGVLQVTNLHTKIAKKWRELRGETEAGPPEEAKVEKAAAPAGMPVKNQWSLASHVSKPRRLAHAF